jgi:hypothetical protein
VGCSGGRTRGGGAVVGGAARARPRPDSSAAAKIGSDRTRGTVTGPVGSIKNKQKLKQKSDEPNKNHRNAHESRKITEKFQKIRNPKIYS